MLSRIHDLWLWYHESGLASARLPVPMIETMAVFVALTFCLLFRFSRTGLFVAYAFVYRWGWAARPLILPDDPVAYNIFTVAYIVFGVLVLTFTFVGIMQGKDATD
jgi:hypothetical protein